MANLNPIGRAPYGASTLACTPALLAPKGTIGLREVVTKRGFKRFRRATQTRFDLILVARP